MAIKPQVVTVQRVVHAQPGEIFDIVANPSRHHEIDGSGTVREASGGSRTLKLGDQFGMSMTWGVPYSTINKVVECKENQVIAWQTMIPGPLSQWATGRTWRYELEPYNGGTLVKHTWDTRTEGPLTRAAIQSLTTKTQRNMEATLKRLDEKFST